MLLSLRLCSKSTHLNKEHSRVAPQHDPSTKEFWNRHHNHCRHIRSAGLLTWQGSEERDIIDPLGLCVRGNLCPEGRAHGLQQGRAVVQAAG